MNQSPGAVEMVPYETPDILLTCMHCSAKHATVELADDCDCHQPADQIVAGTTLVRMSHLYASSKAAKAAVYRVMALPDPTSRRKADRCYRLEPVLGGRGTLAPYDALLRATDADRAAFADVAPLARLVVGAVVTVNTARFGAKIVAGQTRMVVLANAADGTLTITVLGGDGGRSWSKIPRNLLSDPLPREEV